MTKVEIVNYALAMMGVNPIMAFTDNTKVAKIVNQIYQPTVKNLLSLQDWNFALKRKKLNALADNSNSDIWAYAYQEPNELLKIESLRDGKNNKVDYEEIEQAIYANVNPVYLRYVAFYDGIESVFPYYFVEALAYKLAQAMCIPLLQNAKLYQFYAVEFERKLNLARGLDSIRGKKKYVSESNWLRGLSANTDTFGSF